VWGRLIHKQSGFSLNKVVCWRFWSAKIVGRIPGLIPRKTDRERCTWWANLGMSQNLRPTRPQILFVLVFTCINHPVLGYLILIHAIWVVLPLLPSPTWRRFVGRWCGTFYVGMQIHMINPKS
jgi:hypothetical protein